MPGVQITHELADAFTSGCTHLNVNAGNVRVLLRMLEAQYPGLGKEIERSHGIAIDGEFFQEPLAEPLSAASEVFVLPRIAGG